MARNRGTSAKRFWPAALALLTATACMQTQYVVVGPQPAPCTDSIAARVARLPAESVSVADREHALWAQTQCKAALDSLARVAAQPVAYPAAGSGQGRRRTQNTAVWPPPACKDSIAARVARMPAESVSVADREHAAKAQQECEQELAAPPPAAANPASAMSPAAILLGVAVVALLALLL